MLKAAGGDVHVLMQQVADRQNRSRHVIVRHPRQARAAQTGVAERQALMKSQCPTSGDHTLR
jgi:hypothetical protein